MKQLSRVKYDFLTEAAKAFKAKFERAIMINIIAIHHLRH